MGYLFEQALVLQVELKRRYLRWSLFKTILYDDSLYSLFQNDLSFYFVSTSTGTN